MQKFLGSFFGTYSTQKIVEVNDRRLRCIHISLSLAIVIYTIVMLVVFHQGVRFEAISGAVNSWEGPMVPSNSPVLLLLCFARQHVDPQSQSAKYCGNQSYQWQAECYEKDINITAYNSTRCDLVRILSNSWYVNTPNCIDFDGHAHSVVRDSSVSARAFLSRYYYNCTQTSSLRSDMYDPKRESFVLRGVEDFSIMMQHSVSSSFLQDLLVPTNIYDVNDNLVSTIPKGMIVGYNIPIRKWLEWGGVSLDESVGPLTSDTVTVMGPLKRFSGVILELRFEFSNYRKGDLDSSLRCDIRVKGIQGLWGFEGGVENTDGVSTWMEQSNAVQLKYVMGGQVGQSDFYQTVTALLGATVLLSLSRVMTDLIGKFCLQEREKFKAKTIEVHADLRKHTHVEPSKPTAINTP